MRRCALVGYVRAVGDRRSTTVHNVERMKRAEDTARPVRQRKVLPSNDNLDQLDHGLTLEARRVVAEAEEDYRRSREYLDGQSKDFGSLSYLTNDGRTVTRLIEPFGETVVPSNKAAYAVRRQVGRFAAPTVQERWLLPDPKRDASLRIGNEIDRLLLLTSISNEKKANAVLQLATELQAQRLFVSPRTCEAVMTLWSRYPVDDGMEHPFLRSMISLYCYCRSTMASPTPAMMECVMQQLALVQGSGAMARRFVLFADQLFADSEKYVFPPTPGCYAAYFTLCNRHERMHVALTRYADAVTQLHIEPSTLMIQALLAGLNQNGLVDEAVMLIGRIHGVVVDAALMNTILETFLLANDPTSCFAAFEACKGGPALPTSETYATLLLVCEKTNNWAPTRSLLASIQEYKVRCNAECLNLLLKGLLNEKLSSFAHQLVKAMHRRGVEVWPALQSAMNNWKQSKRRIHRTHGARHTHGTLVLGPGQPHAAGNRFIRVSSQKELREIGQRNRLLYVSPQDLRDILMNSGVSVESTASHVRLAQLTHKLLFGVLPSPSLVCSGAPRR